MTNDEKARPEPQWPEKRSEQLSGAGPSSARAMLEAAAYNAGIDACREAWRNAAAQKPSAAPAEPAGMREALKRAVIAAAERMEMRHTERGIPTGELWRGITHDAWQRARAEFREAVDALAQPRPDAAVVEALRELDVIVGFLTGATPMDGVWYGDKHPTEKGAFWWRPRLAVVNHKLRAALASIEKGETK